MVDWNAIKAEYISGNTSYRKIAAQYGVSFATVRARAEREKWTESRKKVQHTIVQKTAQKTATAAADNAVIAERIRQKLLKKLEKEIDALPENIGSQTQQAIIDNEYEGTKGRRIKQIKEARKEYNLRDLSTAYKNLTADIPKQEDAGTLEKLDELLEVAWNVAYGETS